jgi:lipopolysaccharide assembly outer membrane protein LptD (OstA)
MKFLIFLLIAIEPVGEKRVQYTGKVTIYADEYIYSSEEKIYLFRGDVLLKGENFEIRAPLAIYDELEKKVFTTGGFSLKTKEEWIEGDEVEYDVETGNWRLINGKAVIKRGVYSLEAEEIKRKEEMNYEISCGSFTPCRCPDRIPSWSIEGNKMELKNDWFIIREGNFSVKNVPLFYFPYFAVPVVKERKTGFLLPKMGYSERDGFQYYQPFFITMGDDKDFTIEGDILTSRGIGGKGVFRYAIPYEGYMEIKGSYFFEAENQPGFFLDVLQKNKGRFFIEGNSLLNLKKFSLSFDGRLPGDRNYLKDYGNYIQERHLPEIESRVYLSYRGDHTGGAVWGRYIENLSNPERDAEVMPGIRMTLYDFTIKRYLHLRGDAVFRNYIFESEGGFKREFGFFPEISLTPEIAEFLEFEVYSTPFFSVSDGENYGVNNGAYFAIAIEKMGEFFSHTLKPFLEISHTFPDSATIPYFTPYYKGVFLKSGVKNYIRISDIPTNAHIWVEKGEFSEGKIRYRVLFYPFSFLTIKCDGEHSKSEDYIFSGFSIKDGRGDGISVGYFGYRRENVLKNIKSMSITPTILLHPLLSLNANIALNLNPDKEKNERYFISSTYNLSYDNPCRCWGIRLTYYTDYKGYSRFLFSFYLTGLGEIKSL